MAVVIINSLVSIRQITASNFFRQCCHVLDDTINARGIVIAVFFLFPLSPSAAVGRCNAYRKDRREAGVSGKGFVKYE